MYGLSLSQNFRTPCPWFYEGDQWGKCNSGNGRFTSRSIFYTELFGEAESVSSWFWLAFFFSGLSCLMIIKEGQGQVSILKDFSFFFFESPLWGEKGLPWHPFFLPLTCLSPCINLPNFWGVSPWMKSWLLLCACVCLLCLGRYKAHGDKGFFLFTSSVIHLPWVRPQPHKLRVQSPQIVPPPPPHCFRHQLQVWGPQGTLTSDLLATKFGSSFCILRFENSMNDSQNSEKCHTPYYSVLFFF